MTLTKLVKTIVAALEEIKAHDIEILDVSKMTDLCDRMIIASGDSSRQTKAIANNVSEKVKASGGTVYGIEGEQVGEWVLVDLGDVLVHVMQSAVRSHYNLEELWAQAKKVSRTAAAGSSASRKRVSLANREGSAEEEEMPGPASPSDAGRKRRPRSAPGDSE
jgi:ribosome-associated protein